MSYATQLLQHFEKAHEAAHQSTAKSPQDSPKPEKLGQRFHEIWPKATPVLQTMLKTAQVIPGLSTAAPVLSGLIAIGNVLVTENAS